jgi:hypothetical protein
VGDDVLTADERFGCHVLCGRYRRGGEDGLKGVGPAVPAVEHVASSPAVFVSNSWVLCLLAAWQLRVLSGGPEVALRLAVHPLISEAGDDVSAARPRLRDGGAHRLVRA